MMEDSGAVLGLVIAGGWRWRVWVTAVRQAGWWPGRQHGRWGTRLLALTASRMVARVGGRSGGVRTCVRDAGAAAADCQNLPQAAWPCRKQPWAVRRAVALPCPMLHALMRLAQLCKLQDAMQGSTGSMRR